MVTADTVLCGTSQSSIPVIRQKRIFQLVKMPEIKRVPNADRRTIITIAPGNVVSVLDKTHPRIVAVFPL